VKTPERPRSDAAAAEPADQELSQPMAESLLPLGCLYAARVTHTLLPGEEP